MSWRMGMSAEMVALALGIAAGAGARSPVDYCAEILAEWRQNEVMQPGQVDEYRVEHLKTSGKYGLIGSGDAAELHREQEIARERRRQENLQAGVG